MCIRDRSNIDISSYYGEYLYLSPDPTGEVFYTKVNLNENGLGTTVALDRNFNNITQMYSEHPYSILTPNYLVRPNVMNYDEPAFLIPAMDGNPALGRYINSVADIYLQPNGKIAIQFRYSGLDRNETQNQGLVKIVEGLGWTILNTVGFSPLYPCEKL